MTPTRRAELASSHRPDKTITRQGHVNDGSQTSPSRRDPCGPMGQPERAGAQLGVSQSPGAAGPQLPVSQATHPRKEDSLFRYDSGGIAKTSPTIREEGNFRYDARSIARTTNIGRM